MRLYKMELFKLCHRKLFVIGAGCAVGILFLFFWIKVWGEETYVEGSTYRGYQAVQVNRQITDEFKGVLTDEKVEKIIEIYGFPQKVEKDWWYYQDANFLNGWVEKYLSDGYYYRWDDYETASCAYPIADTEIGKAAAVSGKEIVLEYGNGWFIFCEVSEIGFIIGSILILFGVSIVFANEEQTKMLPLLFTTKEGKAKDIYAKIAASYTVAAGVWLGIVVLDFVLCVMVYGFDGLKCMAGTTGLTFDVSTYRPVSMLSVGSYMVITLLRSLFGILLLCSVTIYFSARFQSCFHAVVSAALVWIAPILIFMFAGYFVIGGVIVRIIRSTIVYLIYASPIYSIMYNALWDCYRIWKWLAGVSAAGIIFCTINAYRKYKLGKDGD